MFKWIYVAVLLKINEFEDNCENIVELRVLIQ